MISNPHLQRAQGWLHSSFQPQTPALMKKGRWADNQINQILAEMPRNAEVALGGEVSGESLTVPGKKDGGG